MIEYSAWNRSGMLSTSDVHSLFCLNREVRLGVSAGALSNWPGRGNEGESTIMDGIAFGCVDCFAT
jgi:hypothetical protein